MKFEVRKVKKAIANLTRELKNNRKVLEQVGKAEIVATRRRIRSSKTTPEGQRWAPWAFSTMIQRRKQGTAGKGLLFNSGRLSRSFTAKVSRQKLQIRSSAKYAKYLQFGTPDMPARPFMGWSKRSKTILKMEFGKRIKKAWK